MKSFGKSPWIAQEMKSPNIFLTTYFFFGGCERILGKSTILKVQIRESIKIFVTRFFFHILQVTIDSDNGNMNFHKYGYYY